MIAPERIDDAAELVQPCDLWAEFHQIAYAAILRIHATGARPDLPTLMVEIERDGGMEAAAAAAGLLTATPTSANVPHHARKLRHVAIVRRLMTSCQGFLDRSEEDPFDERAIPDLADSVQRAEQLQDERADVYEEFARTLEERMRQHESGERPSLLGTGYRELDEALGGGLGVGIHVVAGWSSMGKSAFATTMLVEALRRGYRPRLYSLDMPGGAYVSRIVQRHGGIGYRELVSGSLGAAKAAKAIEIIDRLKRQGLAIVDRAMSAGELERDAYRHRATYKCLFIDHLGKIGAKSRTGKEYDGFCEVMRAVNSLYKRVGVPIILLAQLNNPPDRKERDGVAVAPRPSENEIRGGRMVTADASTVILPWRASYGKPDGDGCEAEIILAKNQTGRRVTVRCWWDAERCEFIELETNGCRGLL